MAAPYGRLVSEQEVTCEKGKKGSSGVGVVWQEVVNTETVDWNMRVQTDTWL